MEDQLPYRAEYAKSGRALCKGCKLNIAQGTLRLAVMVQSAFHDGKQPNWFHSSCFFKKQRPKSVGDIAYYINLKYEDQKMLKEKIDSSTEIVAPQISGKKGKSKKRTNTSDALKDFGVEYAKSGRAECRGCQQKILKDEIRIKKVVFDTEVGMKYGGQPLWHHVDCFEKIRDDLMYFECGSQLPGYQQLKKEDQTIIKNTIKAKTDAPAVKKVKLEAEDEVDIAKKVEEEKTLIKQNADMYKYKTELGHVAKRDLIDILEDNDQYIPSGISMLIDAVADILTFGAIQPCKTCKNGSFVISTNTYVCNGNLDEWVKCLKNMQEPERKKTVISSEMRKKYSFLSKYKSKVINRVFPHFIPSASFANVKKEESESNGSPRVKREKPKLYNMEFVIVGKTEMDKEELKALITKFGGHLKTKIHCGVTAVISNPDEVEKMNKRMSEVKDLGIHVITDSFFTTVQHVPDALKLLDNCCICDWAVDPLTRIPKEEERTTKKSIYSKSSKSSKVTLKLKGGGAVDPESQLEDIAHVFEENGLKYNAILTLTDLQAGKNSYYKLQLLEADKGNKYWLFRSWGRIGTTIGGTKVVNFATLNEAKKDYETLHLEKSGSKFGEPYFKRPGFYQPVDIDYSDTSNKFDVKCDIPSKLESPVQNLIKLLFDVDLMKKVMLEFELDTEKMPLGKLSRTQIERAVVTLNELSKLIAKGSSQHEFIGASNRFYTLIPHDFGVDQPPLLDTNEMIKLKMEMLESLMEIELAYNMLTDKKLNENINPIDAHYEQLKTSMEVLDPVTEEFKILQQYVKNTHAETHNMYDLEIENIFKISRSGEEKRFKPFKKLHNRKLLWHGSRLTNFVGILSHGLKIAPPEAPVTGYMFGKGIYFADMVSKSANYCFTSKTNNTGLLMLCEVALGDMVEYTDAKYVTNLPKNKHSVKGIGSTAPNPAATIRREDGVEIPCGNPVTNTTAKTSLLYNEYIVYDVAQVKAQYLFKLKFNYKY